MESRQQSKWGRRARLLFTQFPEIYAIGFVILLFVLNAVLPDEDEQVALRDQPQEKARQVQALQVNEQEAPSGK